MINRIVATFTKENEAMTIDKDNLCNWCVMTCNLPQDSKEQERGGCRVDAYGLVDAVVIGGYFSTPGNGCGAFDDCTNHRFSLCEFCLNHLFRLFKIPVSVCTLHIAWSDFISQTIVSDNHDG